MAREGGSAWLLEWAFADVLYAIVVGVAVGAVVGRWYRRGGRLPDAPEFWADRR